MSAAALSAAVDSYNFNGEHTHFQAEPILQKNYPKRQPLSGREREGGKDSHSRQWRLSMAVFLNRNKRPSAAPIEVAEAFLRKAASLALPYQSPTRFTAGEEEDDEEG